MISRYDATNPNRARSTEVSLDKAFPRKGAKMISSGVRRTEIEVRYDFAESRRKAVPYDSLAQKVEDLILTRCQAFHDAARARARARRISATASAARAPGTPSTTATAASLQRRSARETRSVETFAAAAVCGMNPVLKQVQDSCKS